MSVSGDRWIGYVPKRSRRNRHIILSHSFSSDPNQESPNVQMAFDNHTQSPISTPEAALAASSKEWAHMEIRSECARSLRSQAMRLSKLQTESKQRQAKFSAIFSNDKQASSLSFYTQAQPKSQSTTTNESLPPTAASVSPLSTSLSISPTDSPKSSKESTPLLTSLDRKDLRVMPLGKKSLPHHLHTSSTPPGSIRRASLRTTEKRREAQRETLALRMKHELEQDKRRGMKEEQRNIERLLPILSEIHHVYVTDKAPQPHHLKQALGSHFGGDTTAGDVADKAAQYKMSFHHEHKKQSNRYRYELQWGSSLNDDYHKLAREVKIVRMSQHQRKAVKQFNYPKDDITVASKCADSSDPSLECVTKVRETAYPRNSTTTIKMKNDPGRDDRLHPSVPWVPPPQPVLKGCQLRDASIVEQELNELKEVSIAGSSASRPPQVFLPLEPHLRHFYLRHILKPIVPTLSTSEQVAMSYIKGKTGRDSLSSAFKPSTTRNQESLQERSGFYNDEGSSIAPMLRFRNSFGIDEETENSEEEELANESQTLEVYQSLQSNSSFYTNPNSYPLDGVETIDTDDSFYESVTGACSDSGDNTDLEEPYALLRPTAALKNLSGDDGVRCKGKGSSLFKSLPINLRRMLRRALRYRGSETSVSNALGVLEKYAEYLTPSQLKDYFQSLSTQYDGISGASVALGNVNKNQATKIVYEKERDKYDESLCEYQESIMPSTKAIDKKSLRLIKEVTNVFDQVAKGKASAEEIISSFGALHEESLKANESRVELSTDTTEELNRQKKLQRRLQSTQGAPSIRKMSRRSRPSHISIMYGSQN